MLIRKGGPWSHDTGNLDNPSPPAFHKQGKGDNGYGDNCAAVNFIAGNFAEGTEKAVGYFADHLKCNGVHAWWTQNFRPILPNGTKELSLGCHSLGAGETQRQYCALKYSVKALSSTAVNFLGRPSRGM